MSAGEGVETLKTYWDHFFKAETGAYEKSAWLDLFLAEFLIQINDGANPKDLINFCPISGVVSLVGCELLCGIHRVTSSINTHYTVPLANLDAPCSGRVDVEESNHSDNRFEETKTNSSSLFTRANAQSSTEILRKYLLGGVAWRCLILLKALGVEGLSCCRQLSSVLIWVFGELGGAGGARTVGASLPALPALPAHAPRSPIHQLFSNRIWMKPKTVGSQGSKSASLSSPEKGSFAGKCRYTLQRSETDKTKRSNDKQAEHSTDSADSKDDLEIMNRSMTIKVCSNNDDFEYFNSSLRSSNVSNETLYSDYYPFRKNKPKADDFVNDKHKQLINIEITTFQFSSIIIELLQELCKAESSLSGSEGSQISVQCINFSLRNLCTLQFGSLPACSLQYEAQEVSAIKVSLTELLMVSLDKVLVRTDLCAKLINNGTLPMLLRILEDVICKSSSKYHAKAEGANRAKHYEAPNKTENEELLKFIFGIAYSITAFFHCLLMQCRSVDNLRAFTEQFKLYGECLKGDLLKECIELMVRIPAVDEEDVVVLVKKLVEAIGKLVSGMKRIRSEVVHTAACPRSRHKVCRQRVAAGMHHHHDILGEASPGIPLSPACCVSVLYGTLTSVVTDEEVSANTALRTKILRVMVNCGVCCCFSPGFLMESIVRLVLTHHTVATLCLQVLEHTVYGELGAGVLIPKATDQLPCAICEPLDDKRDVNKKYCPHGVSPIERKSVWSFLIHYNSLLQLDNHNNVLHATVSHLLRVTPKCRTEMKYELLFSVMYPTFIVAKHRYMIRTEESAYFLTVSCLNIFTSLLNTVSFAEQFIQKGGLSYVLELVSLSEFSKQCCSILEIAIIVEIFKLTKQYSDMVYYKEMSSLASVQMLFESLSDVTSKCYKIYKGQLHPETFEKLCDVSKEREMLSMCSVQSESPTPAAARKVSSPKQMKCQYVSAEPVTGEALEDYVEVLKNAWTFWKSCAALCLYSPMFRRFVVGESVFADGYALLRLLLHQLCAPDCGPAEMRVLIKIIEALLTVHFAVSDVTCGRSKEASSGIVRGALSSLEEAGGGEGVALRALCEALIRVATAAPSDHHAMPRRPHAKVPPLLCASGGSSGAGSSSEDSVAGPYATDRSEPLALRPDDGYEADVEVGLRDAASHRVRKLSETLSNLSVFTDGAWTGPGAPAPLPGCAEYSRAARLAHPDLCIIVVDILTHLIDKLVKRDAEGAGGAEGAAECGALARACCARLAGALSRARAAPRRLLQRLLAPPVASLLSQTHPHLEELQRSILELVHVVASASIEPAELAALLRLLAAPRPPLPLLLHTLQRLLAAAEPHTPDAILTFPLDTDHSDMSQSTVDEVSHVELGTASQSQAAENTAKRLHNSHTRAGVVSPWSVCAAHCGVEGAGWAPWLQGFALTLWLRPQPPHTPHTPHTPHHKHNDHWDTVDEWKESSVESEPSKRSPGRGARGAELLHVVSVGHEALLFELWVDPLSGVFRVAVSRGEAGALGEARMRRPLPAHAWTFLALNVRETLHNKRIVIQVTLFVNGCECETVSLPLQGLLVRKVTPTNVLIGCGRSGGEGGGGAGYHLSGVRLYRTPLLSAYTALHLAAHGPDLSCQVRCESPNFPLVITEEVLDSNLDWEQVYEMSSTTLRELHDSLLLSFSAHAPTLINLYHQTIAPPTVFPGAAPAQGQGASIPETLAVRWAGAPRAAAHSGLPPALLVLGGPDVLLYLYARVVELEGSARWQARALWLVLRAARVDDRLHAQLHAAHPLDALLAVLAAPASRLSVHTLEVVLGEACSASPVRAGGAGALVTRADCVLLDPYLLVFLVRAWKYFDAVKEVQWEVEGGARGGSGSLWALALRGARALLRDDHPRRAFNHFQMNRVDLLRHLLLACKERFLSAECGPLDASASASLVELVRGLMGAPPLLCHLALLCDFLVLMHQASDTFVTHSRANFYFLLTSETQDPAEFNLLAFVRARRASRAARRRARASDPDPDLDPAPSGDTYDNGLYVSTDGAQCREGDDISLDSSKHIKGLINAEIKEARLRDTTSASENSELEEEAPPPPPPAAPRAPSPPLHDSGNGADGSAGDAGGARGEAPGEGEGEELPLNDFVVIDEDDVHHTTVEMYTSGIVHQGRVRAGAAPDWAACEGLLLLLRDSIGVLPDHALAQALCGAVQAESLVVLSNHRSGSVRAAVVRAACALQRRAPPDLARKLRQHFYIHLANQISLYPATRELAAACAALLTKCDVPLEDQLDDAIWTDLSEEALCRCPPLLALLPASLHDAPLAHKITRIIRRIIDKASLKTLSEVCVPEVVVRAVRGAGQRAQPDPHAPLLQDFTELLCRIALKGLAYPHNMQSVLELHHMLSFVESAGGAGARRAAREAQAALVCAQLEYLEARVQASAAPHKPASYFTTVLSSAVLGAESAARAEMGARLAARCGVALLTRHAHRAPLDAEVALFERLLDTLITGVCSERPRGWGGGLGSECAAALQEVVWWAARPAAAARALQPLLLRALYRRPAAAQHITPHEPALQRKLAVYLLTALKHAHLSASVELAVTDWARSWALSTQASLAERVRSDELHEEAAALLRQDLLRWAKDNHHALRTHVTKVVFSKDGLASKVTESAMAITRQVVELQNGERKAFMEHLRRAHSDAVAAAQRWQRLLDEYTHERALWHDPASYPQSWQLDPTEGPGRVRVRLRRAHLDIPPKFLKPEHRYKTEHARRAGPLRGVVGGCGEVRSGLVALLQLKETVRYMARAWHVTVAQEVRGELLLTDRCVHFVPDEGEGEGTAEGEGGALTWPLECVRRVAPRRWCLQERALELFLQGGRAHLLAFLDLQHREHFLRALDNCHLPNRVEPESLSEATGLWRSGAITNWEYIMKLNGLAGRSYNDLMQYPVLPFVLADYTSRILDLDDPASFRDLTKPMAIQNKNREQHYIKNYNDLKLARHEGHSPLRQPHHYASLYSNSGGVLHYLVRLPPFTELFLNYQDNNFDMPDRTFHSLTTTWRLITNDSPTDVKELIPELFYLPELFHNNEGLELGVRQCGAGVDSVEVPPWAGEARMFTLLHRQALEAPLVTDALPHWIDLVFGYKQTGQPAVDALNVFPACTYYGFDPTALELEVDRTAAATMVRTYGQAPRQLLRAPHPHVAGEVAGRAGGASGAAPWGGVAGARWGRYCGSPSMPPPALVARRSLHGAGVPAQVYALPHARAAALAPLRAALLALPAGEAGGGAAAGGAPGARALALLTWGHSDGVVRLKRRRDLKPDLLMHMPAFDHITCVWSSSSSSWSGWAGAVAGLWSGRVVAWRAHGAVPVRPRVLHAHRAPLAALHASEPAHTLASASTDGLIVLWDLHTLSYIRTLPNRDMLPVTHLTISDTLADVASVHDLTAPSQPDRPDPPGLQEDSDSYERATDKFSSLIRVHTVNASFVGSVKVAERVTGVCYSRAPEGVSVNSVAAALHTGAVRLYSSWDLRPVTYIPAACAGVPLLSVAFSSDSALLFGCYAGGVACAWESAGAARAQPVRLLSAHALF